jgi:prepilin-type N-terminal cleavage/methylation domain-containing protein
LTSSRSREVGYQKQESGFTLVEVIIVIALMAIGLLATASMQVTAMKGNTSARIRTERTTWAQDAIEKLMALPYTDSDLDPAGNPHQEQNPPSGCTITWTVTENSPVNNAKLLTVTVTEQGKTTQLIGLKAQLGNV